MVAAATGADSLALNTLAGLFAMLTGASAGAAALAALEVLVDKLRSGGDGSRRGDPRARPDIALSEEFRRRVRSEFGLLEGTKPERQAARGQIAKALVRMMREEMEAADKEEEE